MGEIILNGKSYNSGMKYKEVTQAEYNALPSSKLTDGTLYCITDAPGPGEGFPPMIYSYEEREVGVWVDGKPLYQKTFAYAGPYSGNTQHELSLLSGIKFISFDLLVAKNQDNLQIALPYVHSQTQYMIAAWVSPDSTKLNISTYGGQTISNIVAVINYTKTTDQSGSGKWTPFGTYNSVNVTEYINKASEITLDSNFVYKAYKTGNTVTLSAIGSIVSGSANIGTEFKIFDIDDIIAPSINSSSYCWGAASSNTRAYATASKQILLTSGSWCSFTITWITD